MLRRLLVVVGLSLVVADMKTRLTSPVVFAEFVQVNYTWDSQHMYADYHQSGGYVPENCLLAGIKVDAAVRLFVTVPRWKSGVPGTLNRLVESAPGQHTLTPYPSWDMQREGDPGGLQNCQSMYIERSRPRMWVVDVGLRNFYMGPGQTISGRPGLLFVDMTIDQVVDKYYFPEDVVSSTASFLNDIAVDESREVAYLTDAYGEGGLVSFDYRSWRSRRYSGASTKNEPDYVMVVDGSYYGKRIFTTPVDGIALSEDGKYVYYCAVQGTRLYRLPAELLRASRASQEEVDAAVECLGEKPPSDGIMAWNGTVYYGALPECSLCAAPLSGGAGNTADRAPCLPSDPSTLRWVCEPSTLSWL